jgi:hypothetical protein
MPIASPSRLNDAWASRWVGGLFVAGLALTGWMVTRGQVGGDQLNLLARGWLLAAEGRFIPHGNPLSSGGNAPGGITSLLVGLPLYFWRDYRAPVLLIFLFHLAAYLILDRTLRQMAGPFERVAFAVLYWLNPWRAYFSGFLWNPNYLYLFGAAHLAGCWAQRERARFWVSLGLGAGLMLALQIHPSALLLVVASALLWLRGYFRPHWAGGILGALAGAVPLVPWFLEASQNPAITDAGKGFPGRGLVYVFPLLRGVMYWLRYGSMAFAEKMVRFDFSAVLGQPDSWLGPGLQGLASVVLPVTLALPLLANLRLWRRGRRALRRRPEGASGRAWLRGYVTWCFVAALLVFALSPTTLQMWQGLILLHAAVLAPVLWLGAVARSRSAWGKRWGRRVRAWLPVYAAAEIALLAALALGSPHYRCGGRLELRLPLRHDSPMLHDLGILRDCPMPVSQPGGWWPDVLPPA